MSDFAVLVAVHDRSTSLVLQQGPVRILPPLELQNLCFQLTQLDAKSGDARARHFRDLGLMGIGNCEQPFNTARMRRADPELGKMGTDRIDEGTLLADKETPRAAKHQPSLLFGRLDWDDPHVWPLGSVLMRLQFAIVKVSAHAFRGTFLA